MNKDKLKLTSSELSALGDEQLEQVSGGSLALETSPGGTLGDLVLRLPLCPLVPYPLFPSLVCPKPQGLPVGLPAPPPAFPFPV